MEGSATYNENANPPLSTPSTKKTRKREEGQDEEKRGEKRSKKRQTVEIAHSTIKIYNLSSSVFSDTELDLLRKGLNFAPPSTPNLCDLFIDLNKYIRKLTIQRYYILKEAGNGTSADNAIKTTALTSPETSVENDSILNILEELYVEAQQGE